MRSWSNLPRLGYGFVFFEPVDFGSTPIFYDKAISVYPETQLEMVSTDVSFQVHVSATNNHTMLFYVSGVKMPCVMAKQNIPILPLVNPPTQWLAGHSPHIYHILTHKDHQLTHLQLRIFGRWCRRYAPCHWGSAREKLVESFSSNKWETGESNLLDTASSYGLFDTQMLHVWYIYLHLGDF